MKINQALTISLFLFCVAGAAIAQSVADLPEIGARYVTTVAQTGKAAHATDWIFLRSASRVERRHLQEAEGVAWQRTQTGSVYYERLFPADRKIVEYTPGELRALDFKSNWQTVATLVDEHAMRTKLTARGIADFNGKRATRFAGQYGETAIEIIWIDEDRIPASIREQTAGKIVETRLSETCPLAQCPWQLTHTGGFVRIDYADLGDMENDPFVSSIAASSHGHAPDH